MFKYFKGNVVLSNDKLYSAEELADMYNLWTDKNSEEFIPNGPLVEDIINRFISLYNFHTNDYFYIGPSGLAIKVYQLDFASKVLDQFIEESKKAGIIQLNSNEVYNYDGIPFMYYEHKASVVSFEDYLKKKNIKISKEPEGQD